MLNLFFFLLFLSLQLYFPPNYMEFKPLLHQMIRIISNLGLCLQWKYETAKLRYEVLITDNNLNYHIFGSFSLLNEQSSETDSQLYLLSW